MRKSNSWRVISLASCLDLQPRARLQQAYSCRCPQNYVSCAMEWSCLILSFPQKSQGVDEAPVTPLSAVILLRKVPSKISKLDLLTQSWCYNFHISFPWETFLYHPSQRPFVWMVTFVLTLPWFEVSLGSTLRPSLSLKLQNHPGSAHRNQEERIGVKMLVTIHLCRQWGVSGSERFLSILKKMGPGEAVQHMSRAGQRGSVPSGVGLWT